MSSKVYCRIQAGWRASSGKFIILKSKVPLSLKRRLNYQCVTPAMAYASETWIMPKAIEKLLAAQHKMDRSMLGSTWVDERTD